MPKVNKTVHYRRFDPKVEPWTKGSLHAALTRAFAAKTDNGSTYGYSWEARIFPVIAEPELKRFCHNIVASEGAISGTLCLFSPEDWAPVLRRQAQALEQQEHKSLDQTLRQIEIAERPPLEDEDYLRGVAHWLVVGDHFLVVQHSSIQTKAFEEYFSALLNAAGVLNVSDKFGFKAVFNKTIAGGDLENISAVEVGGLLTRGRPEVLSAQPDIVLEEQSLGRSKGKFEKALAVLEAVLGEPDAQKIVDQLPSDAELEVDVRFGYKTRRKGVSRAALNDIARAARNLPDGEVVAFGRDGKQMGDDLRLSMPMPFTLLRDRGALLDLEDARTQLLRVYQRFVEDGKIEA